MNQAKRQLSVDMSWEDDNKKLRTSNELRSSIEDLSNELIYEIFDYFDACEIFNQFSNLNQRFQNLILHSNLPLRVHYASALPAQSFERTCHQMIIPNIHRILSLHLFNRIDLIKFLTLHTIDSSFYRLESLIICGIKSEELVSFLPNLMTLPCLVSLKISLDHIFDDMNEIYRLIFRLPKLKYNQISANALVLQDSISITGDEQFSSIEHLIINHPCTLSILHDLLIHTPNLRRLTCENLSEFNENLPKEIPLRLFNLTYCSIRMTILKFDQLEVFIKNLSGQLRVLHLNETLDVAYLDADRWERLISRYMPYLRSFQFEYSDRANVRIEHQRYHSLLHRFTSSFWVDRGWILNIRTDLTHWPPIEIIYSIQTHRENISFSEQESMDVSKSMAQWTVRNCHFMKYDQLFIDYIQFISLLVNITSLHIEFNYFSLDVLLEFVHRLPSLDSLTIAFTALNQIKPLTQEQISMIPKVNKLTKVNVEKMIDLTRMDILIHLCPQMGCLQVACRDYFDLEPILRLILKNRRPTLSSVSFKLPAADDSMVKKLQSTINFEKLLLNYSLQRIDDRILLNCQTYC